MKKEVTAAAICKATSLGCLIATIGILARTINATEFGIYMLYQGTVQLAAVFTQLGLHQVLMRRLAERLERHEKTQAFIFNGLSKVLMTSLCITVIGGAAIWFVGLSDDSHASATYLSLGLGWAVLAALQLAIGDSFKAFKLSALSFVYGETGTALMTLLLVFASCQSSGMIRLETVFHISIISSLVFIAFGFVHLLQLAKKHDMQAKEATHSMMGFQSGWRIWLAYTLLLAVYPVILWFAGYYGSVEVAGQFAVAHKLATLIVLPMLVTNSMMPRRIISYKLHATGRSEIQNISLLATGCALAGVLAIMFAGDVIVSVWLGSAQANVSNMAQWIQMGKLVTVAFGASNIILVSYNQEHRFVEAGILTGLTLITLLYLPIQMEITCRIIIASISCAVVHATYQFVHSLRTIGFFYPLPDVFRGVGK